MNIVRIVYEWPPPWEGLVAHPYELTRSQSKLGHSIKIFCGRWPRNGKQQQLPNVEVLNFMDNSSLPFRAPLPGTLLITFAPLLLVWYLIWRRKNKDIDILHSHGHFGMYIYLYRKLLKKYKPESAELKIPLIVHFHNTVVGRWKKLEENNSDISGVSKILDWPLAKKSDQLAVDAASALIFVSQKNLEEAVEYYGADRSRCYVVETGVNPDMFKPVGPEEKSKVHKDLGIEPTDKLLLNLGMLVERKNIHLLVESLLYLPKHYNLLLVGPFSDPIYKEKVDKLINDKKLTKRVFKGGIYPYPEVPILYQAADLFVLPSSFEGMPKVVMESLACGTPVIGSGFKLKEDISGLYYFDNLSPEKIAEKILEVDTLRPYVDRDKVIYNYSWDNRAVQIEEIYKKVLTEFQS